MGKLSTFTPVTEEVEVSGGQTITVRGLSVTDLGRIIHTHADTLDSLYQEHIVGSGDDTPEVDTLVKALMTEAPTAVAAMIAAANDEPEAIGVVMAMPGMDQIKLLIAVAQLTFHSEQELKKVAESLIRGMTAVTNVVTPADQALPKA
tara:strand:- start:5312 stop:5755 length:444 start_codon:yes stop_codon:yes gene_type:complete